jgi:hypothetical protein
LAEEERISWNRLQEMPRQGTLLAQRENGMALQRLQVVDEFEKRHSDARFESSFLDLVHGYV